MKYEWRKKDKQLYLPKDKPEIVTVPNSNFFMLDGKGNPNSEEILGRVYQKILSE